MRTTQQMSITLPNELAVAVRAKVASGEYASESEPATNRYTTIPNHPGDMPEGTLRAILNQADIAVDVFLQKK
jgi:hypothetical protein